MAWIAKKKKVEKKIEIRSLMTELRSKNDFLTFGNFAQLLRAKYISKLYHNLIHDSRDCQLKVAFYRINLKLTVRSQ